MTQRKSHRPARDGGSEFLLAAGNSDRNQKPFALQYLLGCNNRIIATHIGDLDEVQAWSARLALDAADWLGARRRA